MTIHTPLPRIVQSRFLLAGAIALLAGTAGSGAVPAADSPMFHLFFLGHDIGGETDVWSGDAAAPHLQSTFHFVDRGTAIDLTGSLDLAADRSPTHLVTKGRNYRLFASDSEVTIAAGRAHVRDLKQERDVEIGGKPFFPVDNYAPIGVQEALIKYWLAHGRPAEIASAPSGPIRITSRGKQTVDGPGDVVGMKPHTLERLAIDGVVWGCETAWIGQLGQVSTDLSLVAVTTWAGALPFEAIRTGWEAQRDTFIKQSAVDRVADLEAMTRSMKPLESGAFAIVGATVIDGTDHAPVSNGTIIIRDGRIAAVGPAASVEVPKGMAAVDAKGQTIIPGLWDMHAHAGQVDWAPAYLAGGVTAIRDMGGEEAVLIAIRDAIQSGRALGPRYLLAGLIDGPGPRAFGMVTASTPDEAVAIVRRYHDEHFQEIKIYIETPAALVPVITAEAHRLGMTVTGHLPAGLTWQTAVEAGYDGIAHMQLRGQSGSDQSKEQIAFYKAHGTVMDPTQSWNELSSHSMAQPLEALLPGASRLPAPLRRMFDSMAGGNGGQQTNSLKLLKDAVDAGLLVVAGTDKGVPGLSLQREVELYVDGGMTPLQAIQAATIMPAKAMKLDKDTGTIEVGKRADLVVLSANPLDRITNIRAAVKVVAAGRLYDCASLWKAAGFAQR